MTSPALIKEQLELLYQRMSDLTAPECATQCKVPHSCCAPEYCDLATERAKEWGVKLKRTDHPKLPYMGPTGCVVPPHLRAICTVHTCAVNNFGFKPKDPNWTAQYFTLRDRIESLEYELMLHRGEEDLKWTE